LRDLVNASEQDIRARLITELQNLTPRAFEHFCKEFLAHLGYRNVEVTRLSQDGGIDGHGDFRQGADSWGADEPPPSVTIASDSASDLSGYERRTIDMRTRTGPPKAVSTRWSTTGCRSRASTEGDRFRL